MDAQHMFLMLGLLLTDLILNGLNMDLKAIIQIVIIVIKRMIMKLISVSTTFLAIDYVQPVTKLLDWRTCLILKPNNMKLFLR